MTSTVDTLLAHNSSCAGKPLLSFNGLDIQRELETIEEKVTETSLELRDESNLDSATVPLSSSASSFESNDDGCGWYSALRLHYSDSPLRQENVGTDISELTCHKALSLLKMVGPGIQSISNEQVITGIGARKRETHETPTTSDKEFSFDEWMSESSSSDEGIYQGESDILIARGEVTAKPVHQSSSGSALSQENTQNGDDSVRESPKQKPVSKDSLESSGYSSLTIKRPTYPDNITLDSRSALFQPQTKQLPIVIKSLETIDSCSEGSTTSVLTPSSYSITESYSSTGCTTDCFCVLNPSSIQLEICSISDTMSSDYSDGYDGDYDDDLADDAVKPRRRWIKKASNTVLTILTCCVSRDFNT